MDISGVIKNRLERISGDFEYIDGVREVLLKSNRELLSKCVHAIKLIYNGDYEAGKRLLGEAYKIFGKILDKFGELRSERDKYIVLKGVSDGLREFVEAILLYNRFSGDNYLVEVLEKIPNNIFVEGVFDYLGELRRKFVEYIIEGSIEDAKELLYEVKEIYEVLNMIIIKSYYIHDYKRRLDLIRSQLLKSMEDLASMAILRGGEGE
jgi:translin